MSFIIDVQLSWMIILPIKEMPCYAYFKNVIRTLLHNAAHQFRKIKNYINEEYSTGSIQL